MIGDSRDTAPSLHARGRGREVNSSALAPYLFENILQRIAAHCNALVAAEIYVAPVAAEMYVAPYISS